MKICGIVAEYNPFHNGHEYQIQIAREMTGADRILVCMSGDFVQRGLPAIADKYHRTKAALLCGADLVVELPTVFATSSAQVFATGSTYILDALGADYICFGSETGDIKVLNDLSDAYLDIEKNSEDEIKCLVRNGMSYPKAVMSLLKRCNIPQAEDILSNDKLGIAYINAIKSQNLNIIPCTVKREGNYLDNNLLSGSALSIRNEIEANGSYDKVRKMMPLDALTSIFSDDAVAVFADDFSDLLYGRIMSIIHSSEDVNAARTVLCEYLDVSENIAGKIVAGINGFTSITGFADSIHSPEYTMSRINRALIHILLDIKTEDSRYLADDYYARILGINKRTADIMSEIKNRSRIPLISKAADAKNILSTSQLRRFNHDVMAAEYYEYIFSKKSHLEKVNELSKGNVYV